MKFILCRFCTNLNAIREDKFLNHCQQRHSKYLGETDLESYPKMTHKQANLEVKRERDKITCDRIRLEELSRIELENRKKKQHNEYIKSNTYFKQYNWDNFDFGENQLLFPIEKCRKILNPIRLFGVNQSLNLIKNSYFKRLYGDCVLEFTIFQDNIIPEESGGYKIIKDSIELAIEFLSFCQLDYKKIGRLRVFENISRSETINILREFKNPYIDYLAINQDEKFKVIPILEYMNGKIEQSLLFRTITESGKLLIVWENINPNRATHLFLTNQEKSQNILAKIEEYLIRDDISCKRSLLYDSSKFAKNFKKEISYIGNINHTLFEQYSLELANKIRL